MQIICSRGARLPGVIHVCVAEFVRIQEPGETYDGTLTSSATGLIEQHVPMIKKLLRIDVQDVECDSGRFVFPSCAPGDISCEYELEAFHRSFGEGNRCPSKSHPRSSFARPI